MAHDARDTLLTAVPAELTVARLETLYQQALSSAESFGEVEQIRDKAEVFRLYLKYHNMSADLQNLACEIKARADRRMGEILIEVERRPVTHNLPTFQLGTLAAGSGEVDEKEGIDGLPPGIRAAIANLGIGSTEAWRWQQLARIPRDLFDDCIARLKQDQGELTIAGLLRLVKTLEPKATKERDPGQHLKVRCVSNTQVSAQDQAATILMAVRLAMREAGTVVDWDLEKELPGYFLHLALADYVIEATARLADRGEQL